MYNSKKILAFIGARAGSKGIKDKNIIDFAGKPLIAWTIEAAQKSSYIDHIIVSTDSHAIAEVAKISGAEVPFLRPEELATDQALIDEAIEHCINWLKESNQNEYDYLILLQPTSPLRSTASIDQAMEYFFEHQKSKEDTLMSVGVIDKKFGWIMKKKDDGYIEFCVEPSKTKGNRQQNPDYYLPNGAIYFGSTEAMKNVSANTSNVIPFEMGPNESIDIDTNDDLEQAIVKLNEFRVEKESSYELK